MRTLAQKERAELAQELLVVLLARVDSRNVSAESIARYAYVAADTLLGECAKAESTESTESQEASK